jgi:hypothetical protein
VVVQLVQIGASQVPDRRSGILQSQSRVAGAPQAHRLRGPPEQTIA